MADTLAVVRAAERMRTRAGWLDSSHSFSFGGHYDATNTHFGLLLVSNDDRIDACSGFGTHPHRDMEIVTWVLDGALVHQDSQGHSGLVTPGLAQRMSAGSGILHSERSDGLAGGGTHVVQMWVVPDSEGVRPSYGEADVVSALAGGGLVPIAGGRPGVDAAIGLGQRDAVLWGARVLAAQSVSLPVAPYVHLFVARGAVVLEGAGPLVAGDAVRLTGSDGRRALAGADGAELLVWEMHSALGGAAQ